MLELSERDFNVTHMLENPPEKRYLCTHMGNFNRGIGTILENLLKILEIKIPYQKYKIYLLNLFTSRKPISELEDKKTISKLKYKEKRI